MKKEVKENKFLNVMNSISSNKILKKVIHDFKNVMCILFFALALEAFAYKTPYYVSLGFLLLSFFILLFPYFDKIFNKINIYLNTKQKWFIAGLSFLTSAFSLKPETKEYYRSIISLAIYIIIWVIVILYSKRKDKKLKK